MGRRLLPPRRRRASRLCRASARFGASRSRLHSPAPSAAGPASPRVPPATPWPESRTSASRLARRVNELAARDKRPCPAASYPALTGRQRTPSSWGAGGAAITTLGHSKAQGSRRPPRSDPLAKHRERIDAHRKPSRLAAGDSQPEFRACRSSPTTWWPIPKVIEQRAADAFRRRICEQTLVEGAVASDSIRSSVRAGRRTSCC